MKSLYIVIIIVLVIVSLSVITAWQQESLVVVPVELNMGSGVETRTKTTNIMLYNTGTELAEISHVTLTGSGADRFLVDRTLFTIAAGDSTPFTIQFIPEKTGVFSASLVIESNLNTIELPLTATGVKPATGSHNTVFTDSRFSGADPVINLSPGAGTRLYFNYHSWSRTGCPGCIIYVAAGVEGDGQGTIGLGITGRYPGESGSSSIALAAPQTPGIYTVYGLHAPDVSSGNAIRRYESSFFSDAHMPVGLIAVVDPAAPSPPSDLRAIELSGNVTLNWEDSLQAEVAKYYIYRSIMPNILSLIDSVSSEINEYTDPDTRTGLEYFYRLRSRNDAGVFSGFSPDARITPTGIDSSYVNLWVDIVGRDQVRAGRASSYNITFGNSGNLDLGAAWLYLLVPDDFYFKIIFDQEEILSKQLSGSTTDSVKIIPLFVKGLYAGSKNYFEFTIKPPVNAQNAFIGIEFDLRLEKYLPGKESTSIRDSVYTVQNKYLRNVKSNDMVYSPSENNFTRPRGEPIQIGDEIKVNVEGGEYNGQHVLIYLGNDNVGHHFFNGSDEFDINTIENQKFSGHSFRVQYILPSSPDVDINNIINNWKNFRDKDYKYKPVYNQKDYDNGYRSCLDGPLDSWYGNGNAPEYLYIDKKPGLTTNEVNIYLWTEYLRDTYEDIDILPIEDWITVIPSIPFDVWKHLINIRIVRAWDPNEKAGLSGYGRSRYVASYKDLFYTVFFENVDSATAPAQEVRIVDTLDLDLLDVTTFSLGSIKFGAQTITPPDSQLTFNTDVMVDTLKLAVSAELDTDQGVLSWYFKTIDPNTGELPEDPLAGFLPPNKKPPEGEGSVSFIIKPKASLATGTQIVNEAHITFDLNSQIKTGDWINVIDNVRPTSYVANMDSVQTDTTFAVSWQGSDQGSGIYNYSVYVSENHGPFGLWLADTPDTSGFYTGQANNWYSFYSIARDSAGNMEFVPTRAEALTFVDITSAIDKNKDIPVKFNLAQNYPNPFNPNTTIKFSLPKTETVKLEIYNVLGQRVKVLVNRLMPVGYHEIQFNAREFASGLYFYRIQAGIYHDVKKMVLLK